MRQFALPVLIIAMAFILASGTAPAETAEEARILNGQWNWSAGDTGDLEAVFVRTGDTSWTVNFNFEFRGDAKTYSGTAEGTLTGGALSGTVQNEERRRTFSFTGSFEDGTFRGTHREETSGRERSTGTLTLSAG